MADYKVIVPFILKWEGGLSRATTDTASRNPSPCPVKGVTGYHTNKGVTWATFTGLAPKLGYTASCENFVVMPESIWGVIFKRGFWDEVGGDKLTSQAIANVAADFAWGAGPFQAVKRLQMAINKVAGKTVVTVDGKIGPATIAAANSSNQLALFNEYTTLKDAFYKSLPGNEANQRGWSNRHTQLVEFSKKHIKAIGGTLFFFVLVGVAYLNRDKLKNLYHELFGN